ncbi:hypothetical protein Q0601_06625 [Paracoccus onubensis]|uniref:hypothetical protein n=1 Tax=Paracoccus onubensis TaxID=1675788 RepID=UPI00272F092A|nr:hypothetical protein [Paracoccus onubensis]MDP0926837.1 hypothetical protein [Paracoccus onubensis]
MSRREREGPDNKDPLQKELSERRKEIEQEPIPERIQELAERLQQVLANVQMRKK